MRHARQAVTLAFEAEQEDAEASQPPPLVLVDVVPDPSRATPVPRLSQAVPSRAAPVLRPRRAAPASCRSQRIAPCSLQRIDA
jgi:hypothetical protein